MQNNVQGELLKTYDNGTKDYRVIISCLTCQTSTLVEVKQCYCDIDIGGGQTFSDENGDCTNCEKAFTCSNCGNHMLDMPINANILKIEGV